MKKVLHCCLLVIFILSLTRVNAQQCANGVGASICAPDNSFMVEGFEPPDTSLPCIIDGVFEDTVIQFHTPADAQGFTLDHVDVVSISNLPCGMCWSINNMTINGNSTGCIRVQGTCYDAPGEYLMNVEVNAYVSFAGSVIAAPGNPYNLNTLGLKYYARVRLPNGPCVAIDTLSTGLTPATIGSIVTPSISATATSFCAGGSTTLTASGANYYGYVWSNGVVGSSITVTTGGTYTVTVYDNCTTATASQVITVNPGPTATITASSDTLCSGNSATLTAGGGGTYIWSNTATSSQITVSPASTTNYTVTVTGSNLCSATAVKTLTVKQSPTASISPGIVSLCGGANAILIASGGASYSWSNGVSGARDTVSPASTTSYTVTVSNANQCTATASRNVVVGTVVAHASALSSTTFCTGGSVTLTVDSVFDTYLWSNNATTQSITINTPGSYTCSVTHGTCSGSTNSVTVSLSTSALTPIIMASPSLNICPGGSATLDAGAGYSTYRWSNNATSQIINVTTQGSYTVSVSQNACNGSASATVNIGNFPVQVAITPAGPVTACADSNMVLDAGAGFNTYTWSNGEHTQSIRPSSSNSYTVTVTKNLCSGSDSIQVTINPNPHVVIATTGSLVACTGDTVVLDAGAGYSSYRWNNGTTTQTIQPTVSGSYSVTVGQNNCLGNSDTVPVTFNPRPSPVVTPSGNVFICSGHSVTIQADTGYSTYAWTNGSVDPSITVTNGGAYNVTVTKNGCIAVATYSANVIVNPTPSAQLVVDSSNANALVLNANPQGASYQWLFRPANGGGLVSLPVLTGKYSLVCGAQNYGQYYVVVTSNGCPDTSVAFNFICSGINEINALIKFSIQPNPATDDLNVSYELNGETTVALSVFDLAGRKVIGVLNERESIGSHNHIIKVGDLAPGIYLLNFVTENGNFNIKFVKQ